jgi:hypothetical protein
VVFVGAPDYLKQNWDQSLTSGLVYIYTYCAPGEYSTPVYRNGGLERTCRRCPGGTWSQGGHATACTPCVPPRSRVIDQCRYECVSSYFGAECLLCSQSELARATPLPGNASWVDYEDTCRWRCNAGFNSVDGETCTPCAQDAAAFNGEWVLGTCGWQCKEAFFGEPNATQPSCVPCSALKQRQGQAAPANAYWVDGWLVCTFVPQVGFRCNGSDCTPCAPIPVNANWSEWEPQEQERCDYECLPGA